ncbi:MAG TPA: hypothetical protein VL198_04305 [Pseudolabrys sp.]|jgi:hypothetical protein|nr:hypothetical protein [Pseudolabrys sp.]
MDAIPVSAKALDDPAIKSTAAHQIPMTNATGKNVVVVKVAIELSGHVAGIIAHIAHV